MILEFSGGDAAAILSLEEKLCNRVAVDPSAGILGRLASSGLIKGIGPDSTVLFPDSKRQVVQRLVRVPGPLIDQHAIKVGATGKTKVSCRTGNASGITNGTPVQRDDLATGYFTSGDDFGTVNDTANRDRIALEGAGKDTNLVTVRKLLDRLDHVLANGLHAFAIVVVDHPLPSLILTNQRLGSGGCGSHFAIRQLHASLKAAKTRRPDRTKGHGVQNIFATNCGKLLFGNIRATAIEARGGIVLVSVDVIKLDIIDGDLVSAVLLPNNLVGRNSTDKQIMSGKAEWVW